MKELNFPAYTFKIQNTGEGTLIFDEYRKKWISLTPEERVRQHALRYLIEDKNYPRGLLAVEHAIEMNNIQKRCDAVFYTLEKKPLLIMECKAPDVVINQRVFEQAMRYNICLQVNYLFITNGLQHYFFKTANNGLEVLNNIPAWEELI